MFMLGQPLDWVLQEFDAALKLDPDAKDRIGHNRKVVLANVNRPKLQLSKGWDSGVSTKYMAVFRGCPIIHRP